MAEDLIGGRLPVEENPRPGREPGFVASHRDKNGKYPITGEDNPLPVKVSGTFVRSSGSAYPSGNEGDTLYHYDTGKAYLHDGTTWREVI